MISKRATDFQTYKKMKVRQQSQDANLQKVITALEAANAADKGVVADEKAQKPPDAATQPAEKPPVDAGTQPVIAKLFAAPAALPDSIAATSAAAAGGSTAVPADSAEALAAAAAPAGTDTALFKKPLSRRSAFKF